MLSTKLKARMDKLRVAILSTNRSICGAIVDPNQLDSITRLVEDLPGGSPYASDP